MTERKIVFTTRTYGPIVTEGEDGLLYEMPIDGGHAIYSVSFPIDAGDLAVIRADEQRAALLYAALYRTFFPIPLTMPGPETQVYRELILHAPLEEVAKALNEENRQSSNAIYEMAEYYTKLDPIFRRL